MDRDVDSNDDAYPLFTDLPIPNGSSFFDVLKAMQIKCDFDYVPTKGVPGFVCGRGRVALSAVGWGREGCDVRDDDRERRERLGDCRVRLRFRGAVERGVGNAPCTPGGNG